jgi:FAD/FMN-containing dehydrogenase
MMNEASIENFKTALRGELIQPNDENYHAARQLYNAMIDKHPQFIARCVDVTDIIIAVRFAQAQDLLVAIRGGGHNGPGLGSCDDGLVIDLSTMKGVYVDPQNRTVHVAAGCTQGDVDHASHAYGLAMPAGIVSTTGIAGLTLGGGHGYLSRQYGLTIDNLLEVKNKYDPDNFFRVNQNISTLN